jgi:uncharacterized protein
MDSQITITVCTDADAALTERQLQLPDGTTVGEACALLRVEGVVIATNQVCGIWGQVVDIETVLRAGDRLEFYRPLIADPKATRRRRALETPPTNAPEGRSIYARGNKKRRVGTKPKI